MSEQIKTKIPAWRDSVYGARSVATEDPAIPNELAALREKLENCRAAKNLHARRCVAAERRAEKEAMIVSALRIKVARQDALLLEALLQIEYLEGKFNAGTGSGEAVKARIREAIAK